MGDGHSTVRQPRSLRSPGEVVVRYSDTRASGAVGQDVALVAVRRSDLGDVILRPAALDQKSASERIGQYGAAVSAFSSPPVRDPGIGHER